MCLPGLARPDWHGPLAVCWTLRMTQGSICSLSHPPRPVLLVVRAGLYKAALLSVIAWIAHATRGVELTTGPHVVLLSSSFQYPIKSHFY